MVKTKWTAEVAEFSQDSLSAVVRIEGVKPDGTIISRVVIVSEGNDPKGPVHLEAFVN